jgi:hypothetical protein
LSPELHRHVAVKRRVSDPSGRFGITEQVQASTILVRVFVLGIDPGLSRCGYCVLAAPDPASAAMPGRWRSG